jgi:hypothetical protein
MYPLPLRASPPLRQLRGARNFIRPPNLSTDCQTSGQSPSSRDSSTKRRKHRNQQVEHSFSGIWDGYPKFEEPQHLIEQNAEKARNLSQLKRWNGRRSMFLGDQKDRRDGAFARQGLDKPSMYQRSLYDLFNTKKEKKYLQYPCVQKLEYTRRQFKVTEIGIDVDLSNVERIPKDC